jgi:uncharacterized membrane protein HdeD (DUF308 family)
MEVLGVALIVIGVLALLYVVGASVGSVYFLGGTLLASGVCYLVATAAFWRLRSGGFAMGIILGCLCLLAGALCLTRPAQSLEALTFVLGIYFCSSGISRIVLMVSNRLPGWGWGVFSGALDLFLGVLTLAWWPMTSLVLPGTLLGVQLIFSGTSALAIGMGVRRLIAQPAPSMGETPSGGRPATRFQH